jgi:hypothetical protein
VVAVIGILIIGAVPPEESTGPVVYPVTVLFAVHTVVSKAKYQQPSFLQMK